VLPTVKNQRTHQGADVLEKGLAPRQDLAKQCVPGIAPFQDGMEQEGKQVEAQHQRREILLTMSKVVLDMVAFGLEHIVVFVCDLPPPTACLRSLRNVVSRDLVIRDKAIVVELFARLGVDHGDLEPIDRQGLLPVEEEHIIQEAIQGHFREAAIPMTAFTRGKATVGVPKGDTLGQLGMGIGLAHQDEVEAFGERSGTKRLLAVQIIAQYGHVMRCERVGIAAYPAFAGHLFAVLFVMTILRHDVFGR